MLQAGTRLIVSDNSGAKKVKCIKVVGRMHKKYSFCLDPILVSIRKRNYRVKKRVVKGEIYKALLIRTARKERRKDGSYLKFRKNAALLMKKTDSKFIGNRLFGPVSIVFRKMNWKCGRAFSLSRKVI